MVKHKLAVVLMFIILVTSVTTPADAQFWKKKSERHKHKHKKSKKNDEDQDAQSEPVDKPLSKKEKRHLKKEQKRKEKQERKKQKHDQRIQKHRRYITGERESEHEPGVSVKKAENAYPLTKMKNRYRVDILAALYLDELVKGESVTFKNKVPDRAEQGLAFYEGVLIAADSLKKAGFKIDIYIHDIASAKETPGMLVAKDALDSSDLIIGGVLSRDIPMMAEYAKKKQVNFISATAPTDGGVTNNAYFTLMQPTLKSHCEWIGGNVAVKFPGMKVSLLYRNSVPADETAYQYMTVDNVYHVRFRQLLCNELPSRDALAKMFDTTKPNIVIIPVMNAGYADSLLSLLTQYFPSTHFEVYGMPSWNTIYNLRKESAYPNLSVNITMPYYVDPSSASAKYVARVYKRDYNSKAPDLVYRGYETMFWYANLLKKYGTIFNVNYEDNTAAPFTSFEMKPQLDRNGNILFYENKHVFLSKYEGGALKTE